MQASKLRILFIVVFIINKTTQSIDPINHCLGNCHLCHPQNPFLCTNQQLNCDWGFYDPFVNGNCIHLPFLSFILDKVGINSLSKFKQKMPVWNDDVKTSKCLVKSEDKYKQIQVYGPFTGMTNIQRRYILQQTNQVYEISFNLIRNEWIPSNDFLLVQILSEQNVIQSQQIKYQTKSQFKDVQYEAICGEERVFIDKYHLVINNNNNQILNEITLSFSSFLLDSLWAITNIQILSGCHHFLVYNHNNQKCDYCEDRYFLSQINSGEKSCRACPLLCISCLDQNKCTKCAFKSDLRDGRCSLSQNTNRMSELSYFQNANKTNCANFSFIIGSLGNKIQSFFLKTSQQPQFNTISLLFSIYYNPNNWKSQSKNILKIIINGKQKLFLNYMNLTNKGSHICNEIKGNRLARMVFDVNNITINGRYLTVAFQLDNLIDKDKDSINFGVSDVYVMEDVKSKAQDSKIYNQSQQTHQQKIKASYIQVDASNIKKDHKKSQNRPKQFKFLLSNSKNHIQIDNNIWQPEVQPQTPSQPQQSNTLDNNQVLQQLTGKEDEPIMFIMNNNDNKNKQLDTNQSSKDKDNLSSNFSIPITINNYNKIENILQTPSSSNSSSRNSISQNNKTQSNRSNYEGYSIKSLSATNRNTSGIQIVIDGIKGIKEINPSIAIDQLQMHDYQLQSYKQIDNLLYLFVTVRKSFKNGMLTVRNRTMTTNSNKTISRLLVHQIIVAQISISRYDYLSSQDISNISSFSMMFHAFAWVALISIMLMIMIGVGIVAQQNVVALQILLLHIFIGTQLLPLSFKNVISGLNMMQNLNFFIQTIGSNFGNEWIGNILMKRNSLAINTNIDFTNEIVTIMIANLLYLFWFISIFLLRIVAKRFNLLCQNNGIIMIFSKIINRKVNFIDQIWRYQFIAIFWICLVQFKNYDNFHQTNAHKNLNYAIALISFILFASWPLFIIYYTRRIYYEAQYSAFIECFEDIYYKKIPIYHLPSRHHRILYPIFRYSRYISFIALIVFEVKPQLTLFLMAIMNLTELIYIVKEKIYTDSKYQKFRVIENIMMVLIEIIMLAMCSLSNLYSSQTYIILGYVLSGISSIILLNSLTRMLYLAKQKYSCWIGIVFEQMPEHIQNKLRQIQN